MAACLEFASLDDTVKVTVEAVAGLKSLAPDRERSREPSFYQVQALDDFIDTGKTFGEAAAETGDYCLAKAICNYPADAEPLPAAYVQWALAVLDN